MRVLRGAVFDVALDIRRGSPNFGRWTSVLLSAENKIQLYVPAGFAHGFCVPEGAEPAEVLYKCSDYYSGAADQKGVLWSDPALAIPWPCAQPIVSPKDQQHLPLGPDRLDLPVFHGSPHALQPPP